MPISLNILSLRFSYVTDCMERTTILGLKYLVKLAPGFSCSKLTTLLVYVSLKIQTFLSEIRQYFFFKKNISVCGYKVVKRLTS